LEEKINF